MRNTPLPFAAPFNSNELEGVTTNEDLMKKLSGFEPTVRKRTADTIKEEGFKSHKTKTQEEKAKIQKKMVHGKKNNKTMTGKSND